MADDARITSAFWSHPKTRRLARSLGADGVLGLIRLWTFAAEARPRGVLYGMDEVDIGDAGGYPGDALAFVEALLSPGPAEGGSGFLELVEEGGKKWFALHDWADWNPFAFRKPERQEAARIANDARWSKSRAKGSATRKKVRSESDPSPIRVASDKDAGLESPPPILSSPIPHLTSSGGATHATVPSTSIGEEAKYVVGVLAQAARDGKGIKPPDGRAGERIEALRTSIQETDLRACSAEWLDWAVFRRSPSALVRDPVASFRNWAKRDSEDGKNRRKPAAVTRPAPIRDAPPEEAPASPEVAARAIREIKDKLGVRVGSRPEPGGLRSVGSILGAGVDEKPGEE